ncbi:unnamed protein product [Dovyalis caffra]|uniref:Uncharacterized protein n=1 Tax=Dovyalis caffra TaxID=77055 RepID=A0AAV1SK37_9ROSI|nr:unnamed protein product [Dovyalis caffra]
MNRLKPILLSLVTLVQVIASPGDKPMIVVTYKGEEKRVVAQEISSIVLIKMREIDEALHYQECYGYGPYLLQ